MSEIITLTDETGVELDWRYWNDRLEKLHLEVEVSEESDEIWPVAPPPLSRYRESRFVTIRVQEKSGGKVLVEREHVPRGEQIAALHAMLHTFLPIPSD